MKFACALATPRSVAPLDEYTALLFHLGADLLAHGATKQIGLPERVAGQFLGDLHHLFLVDDDALRLLDEMVDLRMDRGDLLLAMLAGIIGRDVLHRPGTVERHQRDDVLDAVRLHANERLAHARRFHLEHADHFAARHHLVGRPVVERQLRKIDLDALAGNQVHRRLQHGQRLEAEEVELHQSRLLHPFHVELGDRHVGARIAIHRHQLRQRPVADDDAGGVRRCVAVEPFQLQRHVEQLPDNRLLFLFFLELRFALDRLAERRRVGRVVWHQLAKPVHLSIGHLEHAPDIAQHGACLQRSEGDDLAHLVAPVALLHVADHLFAAVLTEVDVEVRHRNAVGVEEALEQQRKAQRVDIGDGQRPGDQRARARAAARSDRDIMRLGPFDEVGNDQEVSRKLHRLDDAELVLEALVIFAACIALAHALFGKPLLKAFARLAAQFGRLGRNRFVMADALRISGKARQDRLAGLGEIRTAPRDLDGVLGRLRKIGEKRDHLGFRLQPMVRRQVPSVVDRQQ